MLDKYCIMWKGLVIYDYIVYLYVYEMFKIGKVIGIEKVLVSGCYVLEIVGIWIGLVMDMFVFIRVMKMFCSYILVVILNFCI